MRAKRVLVIALGCAALFVAAAVAVVLFHPGDLKVFDSPDASAAVGSRNPHRGGVRAEGRVVTPPGQKVDLGTEVGGTIRKLHVQEGDTVERGDVLVEFDDTEQRAALSEARAAVHASNARAGFHVKEARRLEALDNSGAIPKRELDRVRSERNASFGDTAVAMGAVKRLEAALAKLVIRAPIDGIVIACGVEEGETQPPGAHILTVANLDELRVEAEVDEFDVGRVAVGGEAIVTAEGFDQSWRGKVEDVPRALVPKGLKPRDPGRPVDTRVLRVKIAFSEPTPLKLGQRVGVRILPAAADPASSKDAPPEPSQRTQP